MQKYASPRRKTSRQLTLKGVLDNLLEHTAERVADGVRSSATLEMQRQHKRYLVERLGARTRVSQLTTRRLERFVSDEREGRRLDQDGERRRVNPRSVAKRLSTLRRALVVARVRMPAFPELLAPYKPRQRFLAAFADWVRLEASLPERRAEWAAVCLWTAQHAGDVDRMTWSDVDLYSRAPSLVIRNTKNRTDALRVSMPRQLVGVLRARRRRLVSEGMAPRPTDRLVDPWPTRGHTLRDHCAKLGLPRLNAIDLRHTAISWMIRRRGITPAAVRFAGHSTPAMIARVYGHALPQQLKGAVRELESIEPRRRKGARRNAG